MDKLKTRSLGDSPGPNINFEFSRSEKDQVIDIIFGKKMFSMQADETGRIYATVHGLLVGVSHKVARQRRKRRGEGEQEGKQLQSLSAPPLSTPLHSSY